jgi:hypothetical protein
MWIYPIVNADNIGEILERNILSVAPFSIGKFQGNVHQDILAVLQYPRDDIFDYPLLAPSPFLATLTALLAVLVGRQEFSPGNYMLKYLIVVIC